MNTIIVKDHYRRGEIPSGEYRMLYDGRQQIGLKVAEKVSAYEFYGNEELTLIKIPGYVTEIEEGAFENCKNLQKIIIPEGVKKIGKRAFAGCENLKYVHIPEYNFELIGEEAFKNCSELEAVYFNNLSIISNIQNGAFAGCHKLKKIRYDYRPGNQNLIKFQYIFNKKMTRDDLIRLLKDDSDKFYTNELEISEIEFPEGVKKIEKKAFECSDWLKKAKLPSTLEIIEEKAFQECGIKEIEIPEGVKKIEKYAFYNCGDLKNVKLPSTLEIIEEGTFQECGVTEIEIPEGVKKIEKYAFYNCGDLKNVKLPSTLEIIEEGAFQECGITEIEIPEGIKKISLNSFDLVRYYNRAFTKFEIEKLRISIGKVNISEARYNEICEAVRTYSDGLKTMEKEFIIFVSQWVLWNHEFNPLLIKRLCNAAHVGKLDEEAEKIKRTYNQVGAVEVCTSVDPNVRSQLRESFLNDSGCHGHVPKILDSLAIASKEFHIQPDEIVQLFRTKKFRNSVMALMHSENVKFSELEAFLYAMVFEYNQIQTIIVNNEYKNYATDILCNYFREQDLEKKQILFETAKWILFHRNVKKKTIENVHKYQGVIKITNGTTVSEVRKALMKNKADLEIKKIEKKYSFSDFKFENCECILPKTEVELNGLKAYVLEADDPRQVMLGEYTYCCQHLGGAGESAMMYGLVCPKAGFWVIEDIKNGKILAQAEIWQKSKEKLVFDNIEFANDRTIKQFAPIIGAWCQSSPYKHVFMGDGFNELNTKRIRHVDGIHPPVDAKTAYFLDDCDSLFDSKDYTTDLTLEDRINWYKEALKKKKVNRKDLLYTDSGESCSVLKMDGQLEPYFQKALEKALDKKNKNNVA